MRVKVTLDSLTLTGAAATIHDLRLDLLVRGAQTQAGRNQAAVCVLAVVVAPVKVVQHLSQILHDSLFLEKSFTKF